MLYGKGLSVKVVLLPGLDGTGILFEPFLDVRPSGIDVHAIKLRQDSKLTALDQALEISSTAITEPCMLIAESYSGRIAYEIALKNDLVKHVFFVASFLRAPSMLAVLASFVPSSLVKNRALVSQVGAKIAFRSRNTKSLSELLVQALGSVNTEVVKRRLREIGELESPTTKLHIPCTYLYASQDNLVPPKVIRVFEDLCPSLNVVKLDGTHFLMQTNPEGVWSVVIDTAI